MILRCVFVFGVMALAACTPLRTTIKPPYPLTTGEVDDSGLMHIANSTCSATQQSLPPHPFTTDGCSVWPDSEWRACCIEHDMAYWCGGARAERLQADRVFRACVAERSNAFNAWTMFWGVRIGAPRSSPLPWRWGYGYEWPYRERGVESAAEEN